MSLGPYTQNEESGEGVQSYKKLESLPLSHPLFLFQSFSLNLAVRRTVEDHTLRTL
jgi:hypothetical protein